MKKSILLSLALAVFVGAAAWGATGAFFSDTETSTGNTFTAGDIDLQIDNESYVTDVNGDLVFSPETSWEQKNLEEGDFFFNFSDVKPGDIGEDTISLHPGSNDAYACMAIDVTATPENGINEPEVKAADVTDGALGGELQNYLHFTFWHDDGDNVYEDGEEIIPSLDNVPANDLTGEWHTIADSGSETGPLPGDETSYVAKAWCFGTLTPSPLPQDGNGKTGENGPLDRDTGFNCSGVGDQNDAQTDGILADVSFYAVQSRNNGEFSCDSLKPFSGASTIVEVGQQDLKTTLEDVIANLSSGWFFYNDTNDSIMTIDQFAGTGGQDHMESVDGAVGAKMVLDTGVDPRYNIATAKYGGTLLSSLSTLKYRVYDSTSDSDKPFLHFNVDFNGSNSFQSRLVYVPSALPVNTWTEVDALQGGAGMWLYSGATWPAPIGGPGTTAHSWSEILAAYPGAKMLTTGAFLGIRVGEPGPAGATGYVDYIQVNGEKTDFVL